MALADLGFTSAQEHVYRALVEQPGADAATLAGLTDLDRPGVEDALAGLIKLGVVREDGDALKVPNPAVALGRLIESAEDDALARYRRIAETRGVVAELEARHGQNYGRAEEQGIERLDGVQAVRERLEELSFYHRKSVYTFEPNGPLSKANIDAARPLDQRTLRRNLKIKTVYDTAAIDDEMTRSYLRELVAQGAEIRISNQRFDRMMIVDESLAVVPIDPRDTKRGAIIVRQPALVAGFLDLFSRVWSEAEEVPWVRDSLPVPEAFEIDDEDRRVLTLLASGATDETAAKEIGVSVRHLRRRIARLMSELGARSRFEAGVEAGRRGWI